MRFEADSMFLEDDFSALEELNIDKAASLFENADHDELLKLKHSMQKHYLDTKKVTSVHQLSYVEYDKDAPGFISTDGENEYIIIVDTELLFNVMVEDHETINKLIRQLINIPTDGILNVIIDLNSPDLNHIVIDSGIFISNLIRNASCKKVFNFGSQVSIADLAVAMCCDGIYVSDFASVSIVRADDGSRFHKYHLPLYRSIVKSVYNYWMNFGLFTADEITGLFSAEAENSIQLMSDEIKARLRDKLVDK